MLSPTLRAVLAVEPPAVTLPMAEVALNTSFVS